MEYHNKNMERQPLHALIVGEQGVGKSTLIRRVLEGLSVSVCGYVTRKEDTLADPQLGAPIHIYSAGMPYEPTEENCVGHSRDQRPVVYGQVFDEFAAHLEALPAAPLILLDEVGIMESRSDCFCQAVLNLLDGDRPILAAVKYKDRPYLNQVRSHPRCRCFEINEDNREILWLEVLDFMREQLSINETATNFGK